MRLASIYFYPVKSTRGHDVRQAEVEPWGLAGDRRYVVTDEHGEMLTARRHPRLLACVAVISSGPDGRTLTLTGPHAPPLRVAPTSTRTMVSVWKSEVELTDCGDAAAAWLTSLLGRPARLAWLDDPTRRPVDPAYGRPGDRVSLADAYPLLLTTTASLARLGDWILETAAERGEEPPEPLDMRRFRPNVVVDGVETPFEEDTWKRVRIGEVDFRVSRRCDRCVLPTIDPDTLVPGKEPTRTLARHRRWDGKVWFGVNLIPDGRGTIAQGDPVTVR
ncbi:MOSC domain-containing protein [Nonomuraea lactucae]|uniref:MOSC domain-containing protein n=1 Tax=Nonomuraea lactucae TaxID=2249762 RepID=UPI000DE284D9|nr:MOSC N-terminal beta barrel domain-containing protein [Nonomuraea lactucae]